MYFRFFILSPIEQVKVIIFLWLLQNLIFLPSNLLIIIFTISSQSCSKVKLMLAAFVLHVLQLTHESASSMVMETI